jgi:L,D-peptidoglycan transpeptidase YkuD (ErfK/YbiS/YcfS/YnhG family)
LSKPSILTVKSEGRLDFEGLRFRCALGKGGLSSNKNEGDGATPRGEYALRGLFYRPDRLEAPRSPWMPQALTPFDGWCDDAGHADYNQWVRLPHPASCEKLWREDHAYDLIVPLGYNDDPILPGRGSAIFLHVAQPDFRPTEGCVALSREDLIQLLGLLGPDSRIRI